MSEIVLIASLAKIFVQHDMMKCRFCTSLEDAFHFLFDCKLHDGIRKTYIPRYYWNRPNIPKLIELFNSNNKKLLTNLGIYIYKAFKFRSEQVISN